MLRTGWPASPEYAVRKQDRAQVRRAFVEFAQEMVAAESSRDVVEVMRRVDLYVDRVHRAASADGSSAQ
jgi:hypothetical protein